MSDLTTTKELLREAMGKHQALPLDVQQLGAVAEIMATCIGMAVEERDTLQSKLEEVEECLRWASENVVSVDKQELSWWVGMPTGNDFLYPGPTLYDALHKAWSARDTTKDL